MLQRAGFQRGLNSSTVALCILLAVGCGRRAEQHREQGDLYLRQGAVEEAREQYERSLEADPQNAGAELGLGRIALREGDVDVALEHFHTAIERDPAFADAYSAAAQVHLARGNTERALELGQQLRQVNAERGAILVATVQSELGRPDEATAVLSEALETNPDSVQLRLAIAANYLSSGEAAKAEAELSEVVDNLAPDNTTARVLLTESYREQGKLEEMVNSMREVAEERDTPGARVALALALMEAGENAEANEIVNGVLEAHPNEGWAHYAKGVIALKENKRDEAVRHLEQAEQQLPGQPRVTRQLAVARRGGGPSAESSAVAARPDSTDAAEGTAASPEVDATGDESWDALWQKGAFATLLAVHEDNPQGDDDLRIATATLAALFIGQWDTALALSEKLPADDDVRQYVNAMQDVRDAEGNEAAVAAVQHLRDLLQHWQPPDQNRQLLQANAEAFAYGALGLRSQAFGKFTNTASEWPQNGAALRNLALMYQAANMPQFAASTLQKLVSLQGNHRELREHLLAVYGQANMEDEARTFAETSFSIDQDDPETIATLARTYLRNGQVTPAIRVLTISTERMPDNLGLRTLLATAEVHRGNALKGLEILDAIDAPDDMQVALREIRAFAYAQLGQWDNVLEALGDTSENDSFALTLLRVAGLLNAGKPDEALAALPSRDDLDGAQGAVVDALRVAMGGEADIPLEVNRNMAQALEEHNGAQAFAMGMALKAAHLYEQAFETLSKLNETTNNPRVLAHAIDALAQANAMEGRVAKVEQLAAGYETNADVQLALASVYQAEEQVEKERAALERAVEAAPDRPDAWMAQARLGERQEDDALAIEAYRRLIELQPENVTVLNNLAYFILATDGDASEAERLATQALEKLPRSPEIMHTLGLAQLRQDELEDARRNLQMAVELRPGDPTLLLDYGNVLIEQGTVQEGRQMIALAVMFAQQLNLQFPRIEEAQRILSERPAPGGQEA